MFTEQGLLTLVTAAWVSLTLTALYGLLETCTCRSGDPSAVRRAIKSDLLAVAIAGGVGALLRYVVVPWLLGAWSAPG
ncbi:MAG: hypothetical protein AB1816_00615 [Bacillota bacterium]